MTWSPRAAGLKIAPMPSSKTLLVLVTIATLLLAAIPAGAATRDTTPPVLTVPADMHYQQKQAGSIVRMTYTINVRDDVDPKPRVTCSPRSGARFAIGTTKVTCTATDAAGNATRKSFRITVTAKRAKR